MSGVVGVAEAAALLGVSRGRVRALAEGGVLPAERIGRSWVLDRGAVLARVAERPPAVRPMSPRIAWATLALLSDAADPLRWLTAAERSRLLRRLLDATTPVPEVRWRQWLARRATTRPVRVDPGTVSAVARGTVPGVVVSGAWVRLTRLRGRDQPVGGRVDAYVRNEAEVVLLIDEWFALDGHPEPNVLLHVPREGMWPFPEGARFAPEAIAAADLLDAPVTDVRSRAAGYAWLTQAHEAVRQRLKRGPYEPEEGHETPV